MKYNLLPVFVSMFFFSCSTVNNPALKHTAVNQKALAFPGAAGFGKFTTGGRGGKTFIVSNLNDKGAGSFREAVEATAKRIIVFAISGTIHLETKLFIKGNVTIAGQSAPGDGICLADNSVGFSGDNIIIRFMRFRMGDKYQKGGMVDGNGGDDAFGGTRRKNIIIDHCSMSWSTDEVFSVYAGDSTTLQWNLISEPLNYSYHFETGDKDYEHHGFGGIWGGRHSSFHHNLFAHCNNRTPRFDGIRNAPEENCDYRNNVIYNWGGNNVYAGEGGTYNIVNNYYKYGPSTAANAKAKIVNPYSKLPSIPFGKFYVEGNYVDEVPAVTANNWLGVIMNNGTAADALTAKLNNPFITVEIKTTSAVDAYKDVLKNVGAIFPVRDTLDERIIADVKNRTGKFIDVQGGFTHGTVYELTVHAWPTLKSLPALIDTDKDGMPDDWENKNGLNANDAIDGVAFKLDNYYSNLEIYLNSLVK
jgi:pectate lyase